MKLIIAALIGFLGLAYSNCGIPLKPLPAEFGDSNVQSGDPNQEREEDSSAVPRTKAYLYLGSLQGLSVFEIDRKENRVTDVSVVAMPAGEIPSWIVFDRPDQRLFVSSANSPNVSSMKIDWTTGIPTFQQAWEIGPASVHLSIYRVASEVLGLLTSYSDSQLSQFNLSTSGGASTVSSNIRTQFEPESQTHSSTADLRRGLIFSANLAKNEIAINDLGSMVRKKSFPIEAPRIVLYSAGYDKVYVVSEGSTRSRVSVLGFSDASSAADLVVESEFEMAKWGADLKIASSTGYLFASVREPEANGVWALPLDPSGRIESTRPRMFIPIPQNQARSIQITEDGQYLSIYCAAGDPNLFVFKLSYLADRSLETWTSIFAGGTRTAGSRPAMGLAEF